MKEEIQPEQIWNTEKKEGVKELIYKHKQEISTKLHKGEVIDESYPKEFKHEFKVLTKEEVMEGRSSAYEFIDFDKQETLEEASESFFNKRAKEEGFENWTQIIVQQEWEFIELFPIEFAKQQQERSYSEEEVLDLILKFASDANVNEDLLYHFSGDFIPAKEWFEQFSKLKNG